MTYGREPLTYIVRPKRGLLGPWFRLVVEDEQGEIQMLVTTRYVVGFLGLGSLVILVALIHATVDAIPQLNWVSAILGLALFFWILIWLLQRMTIRELDGSRVAPAKANLWRPWNSYRIVQPDGSTATLRTTTRNVAMELPDGTRVDAIGDRKQRRLSFDSDGHTLAQVSPLNSKLRYNRAIQIQVFDERRKYMMIAAVLVVHLWH